MELFRRRRLMAPSSGMRVVLMVLLVVVSSIWKTNAAKTTSTDNHNVENDGPIVTATTPLMHRRDSNPFARDMIKHAPYVHWTCYERPNATLAPKHNHVEIQRQKHQCCLAMYQLQAIQSAELCWIKNGCKEKRDKAPFIQHCSKHLTTIHVPESRHSGMTVVPRYTLRQAPDGSAFSIHAKIRTWGQAVRVSNDKIHGMKWFYDDNVTSPLQLSPAAWHELPDLQSQTADDVPSNNNPKKLLALNLTSRFAADQDRDEERYLHHRLDWKLSKSDNDGEITPTINKDVPMTLQATLLMFFPEGVALASDISSSCRSTCQNSNDDNKTESDLSCSTSILPETKSTSWDDFNNVVTVQVSSTTTSSSAIIADNDDDDSAPSCSMEWMTRLALEDDEAYLMAPPVIFDGQLMVSATTDEDASIATSDATDAGGLVVVAVWDQQSNMSAPFLTDVDEAWWKSDEL